MRLVCPHSLWSQFITANAPLPSLTNFPFPFSQLTVLQGFAWVYVPIGWKQGIHPAQVSHTHSLKPKHACNWLWQKTKVPGENLSRHMNKLCTEKPFCQGVKPRFFYPYVRRQCYQNSPFNPIVKSTCQTLILIVCLISEMFMLWRLLEVGQCRHLHTWGWNLKNWKFQW